MKYDIGYVVLSFVMVMLMIFGDHNDSFTHILRATSQIIEKS